ncbi:MAG: hypothetical protein WD607_04000, partial [Candidatus Paceibacterota bacterium]
MALSPIILKYSKTEFSPDKVKWGTSLLKKNAPPVKIIHRQDSNKDLLKNMKYIYYQYDRLIIP